MRVIRENLAARDSLTPVCQAAAQLLFGLTKVTQTRPGMRPGRRQGSGRADHGPARASAGRPADNSLVRHMIQLRLWAVRSINRLGESAAQSILIAEPLLADQEREQGAHHADALATSNELAEAYRGAGRTAEAITLFEQTAAQRAAGAGC